MSKFHQKSKNLLFLSQVFAPTLKENPVDAEIASHRLLIRSAAIRKVASGVYSFLPLGFRVLKKIEQIVREEMDKIGSQEMIMSIIQPAELWHESGRWDVYGPELMRLTDRHGHDFALSPTQEELITALLRNELRSYKELPKSLYHIQWKYRDEIRPRFGLLRSREFLMKDAYSFHDSQESLEEHYDAMAKAYGRICDRLGLKYRRVEADSGQIGGSVSAEFMALADAGEAEIVHCNCGYAANTEVATAIIKIDSAPDTAKELTKMHTPIDGSIAALADFLSVPRSACAKAIAIKLQGGKIAICFIPGDHDLSEIKLTNIVGQWDFLTDDELEAAGLVKGFLGPLGLPDSVKTIADKSLQTSIHWIVGANERDYHYTGTKLGSDFEIDEWLDIAKVEPGDICPQCGAALDLARGIEVCQVFQLGTKYSEAMNARYMDELSVEQPFIMGCYGWGVTRSLAAVVEQYNDDDGIMWPISVAPAELAVLPLSIDDERVYTTALTIAKGLSDLGVETVIDDRSERAGVKFNDADLMGWPYQIIIGKRGIDAGEVELKCRKTGVKTPVRLDQINDYIVALISEQREQYL